jgi:hypothetical protein
MGQVSKIGNVYILTSSNDMSTSTTVTELALSDDLLHTKGLLPVLYNAAPDPVRKSDEGLNEGFVFLRHLYSGLYDSSLKCVVDQIRANSKSCGFEEETGSD